MHRSYYYLCSKLSFVEVEISNFSQCYGLEVSPVYATFYKGGRRRWQLEHKQSTGESRFLSSLTATTLPLLLRMLHSPLFEEEDQKQSTVHGSSLGSPPASVVSTVSHCSSSSPSPSLSPSPSTSYAALTTVRRRRPETQHSSRHLFQLTTNLRCFHRQPHAESN